MIVGGGIGGLGFAGALHRLAYINFGFAWKFSMNAKREEMKQSIHLLNSRCEGSLPPGPNRYSSCGLSARSQAESAFSDKNAVCGSIVE